MKINGLRSDGGTLTFLSCKTFITTLPFSAGSLYIPGTRRALWDLGRLLLLMCYKSLTSLLIMQPRHIRLPVGWSVKTSEKDSSASIDSIGALV